MPAQLSTFLLCLVIASPADAEPVISGVRTEGLTAEIKGQVIIEELNCVACHAAEGTLTARSKKTPRLAEVGRG